MESIKQYRIPILLVLTVLVLVVLRLLLWNDYQVEAEDMPGLIDVCGLFMDRQEMQNAGRDNLLILNFTTDPSPIFEDIESVALEPAGIGGIKLKKITADTIRLKVILAYDLNEAVQVWSVLRQMGVHPLYILDQTTTSTGPAWKENEVLKFQFNPDTSLLDH